MRTTLTFVEWSHGSMEGTAYDNVLLSDGLMAMKVKNKNKLDLSSFKEGDQVTCTFALRGSKTLAPQLDLQEIE